MSEPSKAVFLSYASQDAQAARHIAEALRTAGVEVWFDQSELRGGDAWDRQIRRQIHDCALFIPVISANSDARLEGYFRLEWRLAVERSQLMADRKTFLVPVVVDDTRDQDAEVPDSFRAVQWTRLLDGKTTPSFTARIATLLAAPAPPRAEKTAGVVKSAGGAHPVYGARGTSGVRITTLSIALVVAFGLGVVALERLKSSKHRPGDQPSAAMPSANGLSAGAEKSVAVLPFVDMSEKKDQEYFADGLSEELIDHLAHAGDLKVIARTSSFQFKGHNEDVRSIGERLGVANLLEGSVRTSGKTVRVTTQLVKTSDGSHLWSETYDRDISDIFKVQDSIAEAVVSALRATLKTTSTREIPANADAYRSLLRGRYFLELSTKEDSERAIAAYREAIRVEPGYATAYAELAITYDGRGMYGWMPINEAYASARAAVDRSLAIDPTLAIAHRVRGWIERDYKYDFVTWLVERKRADELNPADPLVMVDARDYARIAGHLDEAINLSRQIVKRDPLDAEAWQFLWLHLIRASRLTEAEAAARMLLHLNPRLAWAHSALALVLLYRHEPEAALAMARQETDELARSQVLIDVFWALDRRVEADAQLENLKARYGDSQAFVIAERYAVRNEKDEAFKWLDRAYDNRVPEVTWIATDESLRNLHGDPRWTAFLRKINLPE
jgi:TolB-like protein